MVRITSFNPEASHLLTGGAALSGAGAATPVDATGFTLNTDGGQDVVMAHGSLGAAATLDPADGNVHTGTLTADCTVTLAAPAGSGACTLELSASQDATGGWAVTWPGSVTLVGTLDTTASTTSSVVLQTLDGGTSWTAWVVGGSGGGGGSPNLDGGTATTTYGGTTAIDGGNA